MRVQNRRIDPDKGRCAFSGGAMRGIDLPVKRTCIARRKGRGALQRKKI